MKILRKLHLIPVFLVCFYFCNGQNVDSLTNLLTDSNISKDIRIEVLNKLSVALRTKDFAQSKQYAEDGLILAIEDENKKWEGISHSNIGGTFYVNGKFEAAEKEFKSALKIFENINYTEGISDAYGNLAAVYSKYGNLKESIKYVIKANGIRDSLGLQEKLAHGLNNLSNTYADLGDFASAKQQQFQALSIRNKLNDKEGIAQSYSMLTRLFGMQRQLDSALFYAQKTIPLYEELENINGLSILNFNCGHIYSIKGAFEDAYFHYSQARKYYDKVNNDEASIQCEMAIGQLLYKHGEYEEALTRTQNAINFLQKSKNKSALANAYTNYANILYDFKKKEEKESEVLDSLEVLHTKSLEIFREIGNQQGIARSLTNVGTVFWKKENYQQAINDLEEGIAIYEKIGAEKNTTNALVSLGKCYLKQDKPEKGIYFLEKAKGISEENELFSDNLYFDLAEAYFDNGSFKKSAVNYKKRIEVKDSIFSKEKIEAIANIETKYQTEKKETENQFLKKEQALQAATIQQQKITLWGTAAGIGVLALLSLLFYRQNVERKTTNAILAKQKEELSIKNENIETLHKELAHRVKNNLFFIATLMKMQSKRLDNQEAKQAIKEGEARLEAMSLLHRKLHLGTDHQDINIGEYLKELCANLQNTFPHTGNQPQITVNADKVMVEGEPAVRIGLIVNELVTNSFKYAFKNQGNPKVQVTVEKISDLDYRLTYRDNGMGIPVNFDIAKSQSMGLKLIHTLTKQLNGHLEVSNKNGAYFQFEFKQPKLVG